MRDYQLDFIEFAIRCGVLKFGEFTLKSGRLSPYFFDAGAFNTGRALRKLGQYYAEALVASAIKYELLFGPAYKGIPLVSATSIALADKYDIDVPYVFNRKETKTHGEGGNLVGAPLKGRVVVIDDVITAGTAIREVVELVGASQTQAQAPKVVGVLVAIDRQERGKGRLSAIEEVEEDYGVSVISVVALNHIIEYLESKSEFGKQLNLIRDYLDKYGIENQNLKKEIP